jgi:hypothetical protein
MPSEYKLYQEIRLILWRLKIIYLARNSTPVVLVWNHMDAVVAPVAHLLYVHFNIIFSFIRSCKK